jgi:glucose/arabinose dehydrogenase
LFCGAFGYLKVLLNVFHFSVCNNSLGLTHDPIDVKANPDVYFTSARLFGGGTLSSSGASINGKIKRASGPNLETVVTVISGLPVSDYDHGLNAIVFGDNGELYFTVGSNTNGGVPGEMSKSRTLKENFLSGAINVAYLSHPDFDGDIKWSAPDDGNMIAKGIDIFAAGLRNPFGMEFHSNGKLYAQDNSANAGYGDYSTGCGDDDKIPAFNDMDEFSWIRQGHYYGSPNKKRAEFFNDPKQCKWWSNSENSNPGLTGALISATPSRAGLVEYQSNHFDGQLRGNLISAQFGATPSLNRLILNDDGTNLVPQSLTYIPLDIGDGSLDVTQAPNGNLAEMRHTTNAIYYHAPMVAATTELVIHSVFPSRGRISGGSTMAIYGVNFGEITGDAKVTVGGTECKIQKLVQTLIECNIPGGSGVVDIVLTVKGTTVKYEKGYRYITGLPKPGFVLPVYDGKKP